MRGGSGKDFFTDAGRPGIHASGFERSRRPERRGWPPFPWKSRTFARFLRNNQKAAVRKKAEDLLARIGLADKADAYPAQLSGGQKQRVAIARAMVNNPKILLADEPTGALDSKSGEQIMELFQKLNEEGVTIVMITHDPHIASNAKRMVKIIDGEIFEGDEKEDAS